MRTPKSATMDEKNRHPLNPQTGDPTAAAFSRTSNRADSRLRQSEEKVPAGVRTYARARRAP